MRIPKPTTCLCLGLSLAPVAVLCYLLGVYAVDIPVWDEWGILTLFEKYYQGSLGFADFWQQNNEHRLVLPRLFFLGLGLLTRYNVVYEMGCSVVLAALFWALVARHVAKNRVVFGLERGWAWFLPAAALLVFSLRQHENWFWGFQLQWYQNILAVAGGAYVFANCEIRPRTLVALAGCGLAALFSLSSGVLYWPLMLFFILLRGKELGRARTLGYAASWILGASIILGFYLVDYRTPHYPGAHGQLLHVASAYLHYVLLYCGNILSQIQDDGWFYAGVGLAGLGLFVGFFITYARSADRVLFQRASFFLILGAYGVGCAVLTGIGRLGYGVVQASSSRYATMSMLLWLATLFFLYARAWRPRGGKPLKLAAALLCALLVAGVSWRSATCVPYIRFASVTYSLGREALLTGQSDEALSGITWAPDYLKTHAIPLFRRYRLSVFRDVPTPEPTP